MALSCCELLEVRIWGRHFVTYMIDTVNHFLASAWQTPSFTHDQRAIAHFQKEWQAGARMAARSIMRSSGGTVARAKIFFS